MKKAQDDCMKNLAKEFVFFPFALSLSKGSPFIWFDKLTTNGMEAISKICKPFELKLNHAIAMKKTLLLILLIFPIYLQANRLLFNLSQMLLQQRMMSSRSAQMRRAMKKLEKPMLYAPWREGYKAQKPSEDQLSKKQQRCPFCMQLQENTQENDCRHNVLARYPQTAVLLNLFPLSKGHMLVIPYKHEGDLSFLDKETRSELMEVALHCELVLQRQVGATGVNIGLNVGRSAGASIPDHLHMHVVPRGNDKIGFMQMLSGTIVADYSLKNLYEQLKSEFKQYYKEKK